VIRWWRRRIAVAVQVEKEAEEPKPAPIGSAPRAVKLKDGGVRLQDNPRRLGKSRVRLVDPAPRKPDRKIRREAEFTSSSGTFARVSNAKDGTRRRGTMRNRSEPSQVIRAGFEPGRIAVTLRVIGCYCVSARTDDSGGVKNKKLGPPNEKRRKAQQNERSNREGHASRASRVKNFQVPAMLKTTPPDCE